MAYDKVLVKHVLVARWRTPSLSDGPSIVFDAKQAKQQLKHPILFVSVAPPESPPPPDDLRKYMGEHVAEMLEYCSELHIVIEGKGFANSMKRMAMASIVLISGMRKRMHVHDSVLALRYHMSEDEADAVRAGIAELDKQPSDAAASAAPR